MAPMKKGRYEIRGKLGEGGMGVVFRAWDPPPVGREVAFKTLPAFPDRLALELFYKECSILKSMSHPNVVEIFDMGEFEEEGLRKPFFVMPLLPGQTLDEIIRAASHRLTVPRVVEIISQTCRGLQAAHDRGLIHRDLKPSNIFVMADDSVKIIDFGVAHAVDVRSRSAGFSKGTLLYMAPEQIEHKPVSPQSDIFSLGVVCYEALTRRQPFRGATEEEVVEAIRTSIPPPASDINPGVGQTISRVVHKAMAKQPWNRYDSVRELGETLQKALRNEPIELFDPARIQPRLQRASKALESGDYQFADEIVGELEAEGNIDPQLTLLRTQIDQVTRQKTIAQLLEGARARYEEDEDPLALQKIQEVLKLDPSNTAALGLKSKIDQRRSERQIEQWVRLARQHIDHHAYSPARDALQNVLALKPNDTRALRLLKEVEAEEQDYLQLRREKTEKYQAALNAWKNGEVSEALSQMKVVLDLDRRAPDTSSPETGATYQVFYNKIRSDHDAINSAYAEARRQLAEREFGKALELCQTFLGRYPGHALFQALKFDVEEQQRQQLSAFIADVDRRLGAEPDLDAKVSLLREAVALYPDEQHFRRPLKLMEDKRDLVNSIVARAAVHEERGQISEALNDLEILQTIYSPYPGLKFEKERLEKRLEQQARQTAKAGWVNQIDRHLEAANFARAMELLDSANAEFPDDHELVELRKLATQGLARAHQAEQLFVEGQDLCARGELDRGIEVLTSALELDDRPSIRTALCEVLVRRAQAVIEDDWRTAEALADRVLALEPAHALARSIRAHALDSKRETFVVQCASQARRLQAAGDLAEAVAEVERGLLVYPAEPRLTSLVETLRKDFNVRNRSRALSEIEQARTLASPGATAAKEALPEPVPADMPSRAPAAEPQFATVLRVPAVPAPVIAPPPVEGSRRRITSSALLEAGRPSITRRTFAVVAATVVIIAIAAVLVSYLRPTPHAPAPAAVAAIPIHIQSLPPGATIRINNEVRGTSDVRLDLQSGTYQIEAELPGYEVATTTLSVGPGMSPDVTLTLTPLPGTLRITASDPEGSEVWLDDMPAGKLEGGSFILNAFGAGAHVLRISTPQQTIPDASIAFASEPGGIPNVTTMTVPDRQAVVISTRPGGGRIQSSLSGVDVAVDGTSHGRLGNQGLEISALEAGIHELTLGSGNDLRKISFAVGNTPTTDVILFSDRNVGTVVLYTDQDDASVILDGQPYPARTQGGSLRIPNLAAARHTVRVVKEGFRPSETVAVSVTKGQETAVKLTLVAVERFASLVLERMTPGIQVSLDNTVIGKVGSDGRFSQNGIPPGRHTVGLALPGYEPTSFTRDFVAGEPVSQAALTLLPTEGSVEFQADSTTDIVISRNGQTVQRLTGPRKLSLAAGSYRISAQGPARVPTEVNVTIAAGEPRTVDLRNIVSGPERFDRDANWEKKDDWFSLKGAGFDLYNRTRPVGRFEFTVRTPRGGGGFLGFGGGDKRVRWVVGYTDPRNYVLVQMDQRYFHFNEVNEGKDSPAQRIAHNVPQNAPFIHVSMELKENQVLHQVSEDGKVWRSVETWTRPSQRSLANGQFGFYLQSDDEIAISNFLFHPAGR